MALKPDCLEMCAVVFSSTYQITLPNQQVGEKDLPVKDSTVASSFAGIRNPCMDVALFQIKFKKMPSFPPSFTHNGISGDN